MACTHVSIFDSVCLWVSNWNQGRYVCECNMHTSDPHGAMALQMLPLPHSCVRKRRLLRATTLYTWDAKTPFCVRKLRFCTATIFRARTQKHPFACAKGPFCAGKESRLGTQIGAFTHAKTR